MTDPEPYGVRHFLRQTGPRGRHRAPTAARSPPRRAGRSRRAGTPISTSSNSTGSSSTGRSCSRARRVESRPPSIYRLVWSGRYYDVWQRPDTYPTILAHLPLGDSLQPGAVPRCSDVVRLAQRAGPGGRLAAAPRSPVTAVTLSSARYPGSWSADANGLLYPNGSGDVLATVDVSRRGAIRLLARRLVPWSAPPLRGRAARHGPAQSREWWGGLQPARKSRPRAWATRSSSCASVGPIFILGAAAIRSAWDLY